MRPGILVQHARLPDRATRLVRGDVTGIIGFIPEARWPVGAVAGDFVELVLRKNTDLWDHPDRGLVDPAAQRGVKSFFENGGDLAHLFAVCITSEEDLKSPAGTLGVLEPLFDRLRSEDDIALLIVPGAAYMRFAMKRSGQVFADVEALYDALLQHCREMNNRFLILDTPRGLHGVPLLRWVRELRDRNPLTRSYGALYYPWLQAGDEMFPPSGTVAGSYARIELEHRPFGIVWPPANRPLTGITHTEVELDWAETGELAEAHINPVVIQVGRGVLVHGARTLSHDPAFAHINSRRIVNLIGEQVRRDSEWAVFETNNPHLWDVLKRNLRYRLEQFWGAGLLTTSKQGEQYDVVCDESLNLPADRDAGRLNVQLWIQPIGTAEQICVDLQLGGRTMGGA